MREAEKANVSLYSLCDRLGRANTESGRDHKNKKTTGEWIRLIKILRYQVTSILFYILCQNECV